MYTFLSYAALLFLAAIASALLFGFWAAAIIAYEAVGAMRQMVSGVVAGVKPEAEGPLPHSYLYPLTPASGSCPQAEVTVNDGVPAPGLWGTSVRIQAPRLPSS